MMNSQYRAIDTGKTNPEGVRAKAGCEKRLQS